MIAETIRLLGIVTLAVATGCGQERPDTTASFATITVQQLHERMDRKDFVLVNVHVPYEGDIPGTDLSIPFDRIVEQTDRLPADSTVAIVLYCRSGRMSATAAAALTRAGYPRVVNVAGGMKAWEAAGYRLERRAGR